MRSMTCEDGDPNAVMQGKELYELEVRSQKLSVRRLNQLVPSGTVSASCSPQVMLRVKESEVQYLKQEINSLKEELQAAQRVNVDSLVPDGTSGSCMLHLKGTTRLSM